MNFNCIGWFAKTTERKTASSPIKAQSVVKSFPEVASSSASTASAQGSAENDWDFSPPPVKVAAQMKPATSASSPVAAEKAVWPLSDPSSAIKYAHFVFLIA
jgi:hypothetical protein